VSSLPASRVTGRMIAGGVLIALGVLFTLDNFGIVEAGDVFRYWPLFLVGFGLLKVAQARYSEQRVGGAVLMAAGVLLLLRTLHVINLHMRQVWPIALVIGGGLLIWRSVRRRDPNAVLASARGRLPHAESGLADADASAGGGYTLNEFAFLGGGERIIRTSDFRGGEVTAVMGGFEIDLRGAGMIADEAVLEVFTLWGGVEIRVPEDWIVQIQATPILGGISETTSGPVIPVAPSGPRKRLIIRGTAIMGGVEVKR
jgi:predicted membrane protein